MVDRYQFADYETWRAGVKVEFDHDTDFSSLPGATFGYLDALHKRRPIATVVVEEGYHALTTWWPMPAFTRTSL